MDEVGRNNTTYEGQCRLSGHSALGNDFAGKTFGHGDGGADSGEDEGNE